MPIESYKEDERPADQWYWDDWFSAFDVRLCSLASKGLWTDMLGIMFKAKIRGTLTINGKKVDSKELAKLTGSSRKEINECLKELEEHNVFSRLDDGTIICRRMFRKSGKKDQISQTRSEAGKKGAEKRWQNIAKIPFAICQTDSKDIAKISEVDEYQTDSKDIAKMAASSPSSSSTPTSKHKNIKDRAHPAPSQRIKFNHKEKKWQGIEDEDIERWKKAFPDLDIAYWLERMRNWIIENPRKGRKKNYARFISNWLSEEQDKFNRKKADKKKEEERRKQWYKEKD